MATLTKDKKEKSQAISFTLTEYNSVYTFVQLLGFMEKFGVINSNDKKREEFKAKVIKLMLADGASERFISETLTEIAIDDAISNKFTAESLAWALLQ